MVVEYAEAVRRTMISLNSCHIIICAKISPGFLRQELDGYEEELGFRPVGGLAEALTEPVRFAGEYGDPPRWTERDTYVLARLAESFAADGGGEK